ncbi:MAG: hypothetical protein WBF24_13385, partial [Xanthobacteraceae bacterium]
MRTMRSSRGVSEASIVSDVAPIDIADPRQFTGNFEFPWRHSTAGEKHTDTRYAQLGKCGQRPRNRNASKKRYGLAPFHRPLLSRIQPTISG